MTGAAGPVVTGERGWKLSFLLDRNAHDSVGVVGRPEWPWGAELARHFLRCSVWAEVEDARRAGPYGLILWAPRRGGQGALSHRIRRLASFLAPSGTLMLMLGNRIPARDGLRHLLWALRTPGSTVWGYRRAIRRAGLSPTAEFLPIPKPANPEEFVLSRSEEAGRSLDRPGTGFTIPPAVFHDAFLYLTGTDDGGLRRTERDLAAAFAEVPAVGASPVVERFDLRDRGALVLVCRDVRSGGRILARTARSGPALDAVARHAAWTARLRAAPGLSDAVVRRVPRLLGTTDVRGHRVFLEEYVPATIAWRVAAHHGRHRAVGRDLFGFLGDLNAATARTVVLNGDAADRLLRLWERDVSVRFPEELARALERLRHTLRARLEETSRTLVWGHGDFGLGNALADPGSGALRAVIDWETAHEDELVGVDLLNFLVQRDRMEQHGGFAAGLARVGQRLLAGRHQAEPQTGEYLTRFAIGPDQLRDALGLCCLRWVFREARYPDLFARTAGDAADAVRWAVHILGGPGE